MEPNQPTPTPDSSTSGGNTPTPQPPATAPAPNAGDTGGDTPAGSNGDVVSLPRTAFNDRLERAKSSAINEFLKGLGFEKPDDLKAKLTVAEKAAEAQQAQKTEMETLMERIASLETQAEQATKQAEEARKARVAQAAQNAIISVATTFKARDPQDVVKQLGTVDGLIGEDGTINEEKAKAAVQELRTKKAYLFEVGPGVPSNAGGIQKPDPQKAWGEKPLVRL